MGCQRRIKLRIVLPELAPAIVRWRSAQYDGIVAKTVCAHFKRGRGVNSMVAVLLIAGIGFVLAGLLAIGFGIPVKEFSFGNTLILTGAVVACTGAVMLGLWMVVREVKNLARQFGAGIPLGSSRAGSILNTTLGDQAPEDAGFLFSRDQPAMENAGGVEPAAQSGSPPPWHEEAASRERGRSDVSAAPELAAPAPKPRRNLLFSSSSRKERERAQARTIDPSALDIPPAVPAAPPASEPGEQSPASFDDAWPKPERSRTSDAPPPRRSSRTSSTFTEPGAGATGPDRHPPSARNEDQLPVTVLKSGVVDGMAYSLYSDGSIEAQMPEGMMRFASIDQLRSHLDQRP
jgi:hypothetical protein